MLLVQKPATEPFWAPVMGAQVLFAPIDRTMLRRARRAARKALGLDEEGGADRFEVGELLDELGAALSEAMIVEGVRDWRDVFMMADGDAEDEGVELPFSADNLAMVLADPATFEAFDAAYVLPYVTREREKNASAALPSGTGQAATAGSDIAMSSVSEATGDAPNAPIAANSPKATPGKESGKS